MDPDSPLRSAAGLVDLRWRGVLEVSGRDRTRFLHGMCTNDVKRLKPGDGCLAAVVNRQGKMAAEIVVHALEDRLWVETERSSLEALSAALSKFLVADDVTLRPADVAVLGLYGPSARTVLGAGPFEPFCGADRDGVRIAASPVLGVEGYTLLVPGDGAGAAAELLSRGASPAGEEAWEELRVRNGFPRWGAEMDETVLPMEAGLEPLAISYSKGCYIGQEVIQRVKTYSEPPRRLVRLEIEGAAVPARGAAVRHGADEAGLVTSVVPGWALARVRREAGVPGTALVLGPGIRAVARPLPWEPT